MTEFTQAILFNQAKKEHMLKEFGDQLIEKAMSQSDFDQKYGAGHQVFTTKNLNEFIEAKIAAEGDSDEVMKAIETEFGSLTPVLVKGGTEIAPRITKMYVRKEESSEEN